MSDLRYAAPAAAGVLLLLLAGCGGAEDPEAAATPADPHTAAASSSAAGSPSADPELFNPCDSLDAAAVSARLGSPVRVSTGTADAPRCALLPEAEGGPTFEVSYMRFPAGLDKAWETMDLSEDAVTSPDVPGTEAARMVTNRTDGAYAVTAFIENGDLVQAVNALALAPYDTAAVDAAVAEVLAQLSAGSSRF